MAHDEDVPLDVAHVGNDDGACAYACACGAGAGAGAGAGLVAGAARRVVEGTLDIPRQIHGPCIQTLKKQADARRIFKRCSKRTSRYLTCRR
ncbi:hypothetical protein ACLOJK_017714 [Asimina triloba]